MDPNLVLFGVAGGVAAVLFAVVLILLVLRLADRLSDLYETRVKVEQGRHKGKIIIEYATLDDLERIVNAMTPDSVAESSDG